MGALEAESTRLSTIEAGADDDGREVETRALLASESAAGGSSHRSDVGPTVRVTGIDRIDGLTD